MSDGIGGRLAGRDDELAYLDAAFAATSPAGGVLAVVHGPPGVGKTALLRSWSAEAAQTGVRVFIARGSQAERDVPFGVARQLLAAAAADHLDALEGAARVGASLMADEGRGGAVEPEVARHGLYWLVAALAREPLVLVVDDVQWSDGASRLLLETLRVRLDGLPLFVLCAVRGSLADAGLGTWADDASIWDLPLGPLPDATVADIVAGLLPGAERPLIEACVRSSGGNPLFARELAITLELQHEGPRTDPAAVPDITPERVVASISARLRGMSGDARDLAGALAVLGSGAELGIAASVAGLSPAVAGTAATELVRADLLSDGRPLNFAHPLLEAGARASLDAQERSGLERRAAAVLADIPGRVEAACNRLLNSDPCCEEWAVDVLRRGAAVARARGVPELAATYLRRAVAERAATSDGATVMAELADALYVAGDDEALEVARAVARGAAAGPTGARAAIISGHILVLSLKIDEALAAIGPSLAAAGDLGPDLAAELQGLHVVWSSMLSSARPPVLGLIGQRATQGSARELPLELLATLAFERVLADGTALEAREAARLAWADGRLLQKVGVLAPFAHYAALAAVVAGDLHVADRWMEQITGEIERGGARGAPRCAVSAARARSALLRGDVRGAEAHGEIGVHTAQGTPRVDLLLPLSLLPYVEAVLLIHGPGPASSALEALNGVRLPADLMTAPAWFDAHALVALAAGRLDDAQEQIAASRGWEAAWPATGGHWSLWRNLQAGLDLARGDRAAARTSADAALDRAQRFGVEAYLGAALRVQALAQDEAAERVAGLNEAIAVLAAAGCRHEYARAQLDLGRERIGADDAQAGRDALDEALLTADVLGADWLAGEARQLLIDSGGRPRRSARSGIRALTPAERRVAELAGAGSSNRGIAEALYVTEKSVENHLTRIYRKVGVRSRTQLAARLAGNPAEV